MTHLSLEELVARFEAARQAGEGARGNPTQLRLHRELAEACPAFTYNLLYFSSLLRVSEQPEREAEAIFSESQRLLEAAVLGSYRSAPALVELGHFLDTFRHAEQEAMRLYEEAEQKALGTLEQAWLGKLQYWNSVRTKESLKKALELGEMAERLFPDATALALEVQISRDYAAQEGLIPSEGT